ncbi:hypothetical protein IWQ57_006410, partial [Coemansia nantahalensis]
RTGNEHGAWPARGRPGPGEGRRGAQGRACGREEAEPVPGAHAAVRARGGGDVPARLGSRPLAVRVGRVAGRRRAGADDQPVPGPVRPASAARGGADGGRAGRRRGQVGDDRAGRVRGAQVPDAAAAGGDRGGAAVVGAHGPAAGLDVADSKVGANHHAQARGARRRRHPQEAQV